MRKHLVALASALILIAGPACADGVWEPFAGYRDDGALGCVTLQAELQGAAAELSELARLSERPGRADLTQRLRGGVMILGLPTVVGESLRVSQQRELVAEARQRAAERRYRRTDARLSLLVGLYHARGCGGAEPRRREPGPVLQGAAA